MNILQLLRAWTINHPLASLLISLMGLVFPFLYFPWVVSREHKIPYRTALMNLLVWAFRDKNEARMLKLAHKKKEENK